MGFGKSLGVSIFGSTQINRSTIQIKETTSTPILSNVTVVSSGILAGKDLRELYKKAYTPLKTILDDFNLGTFNEEYYKKDNIFELATKIYSIKQKNNIFYNSILDALNSSLTIIQKAYNFKIDNDQFQKQVDYYKEKSSILDDMDKLKEYLNNLKSNMILFETTADLEISATVDREIIKYIELYGFPDDAIFDTAKMSEIKRNFDLGVY